MPLTQFWHNKWTWSISFVGIKLLNVKVLERNLGTILNVFLRIPISFLDIVGKVTTIKFIRRLATFGGIFEFELLDYNYENK